MNLFQYDLNDGYEHTIQPISEIVLNKEEKMQADTQYRTVLSFIPSYYFNETYRMGVNGLLKGAVFAVIITAGMIIAIHGYLERELKYYKYSF